MNWVNSASDVETAQMKLIYAVMYVAVGIMPLSEASQLRAPSLLRRFDDGESVRSQETKKSAQVPLHKRFQSVEILLPKATRHLAGIPRDALQAKWRWLYRDNCDKMVLRYIRQMGDSKKVVSSIAETLCSYFNLCDPEELLRQGEAHYAFDEPNPRMMQQHEVGKRVIVGHDKQHRPLNILTARRSFPNAQSATEMQKFSMYILELTYMMCQDDVDGAVIVFDMQGFKRANMDMSIMKFILIQLNKLYPMILHRIYIYCAPITMQVTYKLLYSWLDPNLRDRVIFCSRPDQMLAAVNSSQLPSALGGSSPHKHVWIPPRKEDDAPMRDTKTRNELTAQRDEIVKRLERATKKWILCKGSTLALEQQRREILDEYYTIYWLLDPFVRSRTVFDRNGIFGLQRPELQEGGIAQPICKVEHKPQLSRTMSRATFADNATLVSSVDAMSISPSIKRGGAQSARNTMPSASTVHQQQLSSKEPADAAESVQTSVGS